MGMIMGIIDAVRNIRGEMGFAPRERIEVQIRADGHRGLIDDYVYYIKELARVSDLGYVTGEAPKRAALGIFKDVEVFVPIRDAAIILREKARVEKELGRITGEIDRAFNKINNRTFREKAPEAILLKEEATFEHLRTKRDKLLASKGMLEELLRI
jgi:valyl-tRNA synthetase